MQGEQIWQQGQQTHKAVQQLSVLALEAIARIEGPPLLEYGRDDAAFDAEQPESPDSPGGSIPAFARPVSVSSCCDTGDLSRAAPSLAIARCESGRSDFS